MSKSKWDSQNRKLIESVINQWDAELGQRTISMLHRVADKIMEFIDDESSFEWDDVTYQMRQGTGIGIYKDGKLLDWKVTRRFNMGLGATKHKNLGLLVERNIATKTGKKKIYDSKGNLIRIRKGYAERTETGGIVRQTVMEFQINGLQMLQDALKGLEGQIEPTEGYGYSIILFSAVPYAMYVNWGQGGTAKGAGWWDELHDRLDEVMTEEVEQLEKQMNKR